jgi:hypothetical protein
MKGSMASSAACGVQPGLCSLEELRAAALEQLRAAAWFWLGMLEKRREGLRPGREPLAALLGPPIEEGKNGREK